ncbi:thiol-activated cytolysin C-terminal domain-containing protein [Phaeodactylibacter xiamenensis]|uniref:thiol-activated cytolysin C-terminal domain-containing protein n=1 Tax=Phaeodactylibacter xiamenensis TaxID=1524460 RepID=UPI003BAAB936
MYNRTNCCAERLNNFTILVSDVPFTENAGGTTFVAKQAAPKVDETYSGNATGRYVRLFTNQTDYMSIPEIEIFGEKEEEFAEKGTVTLHSTGDYDLLVFVGEPGKEGEEVGRLLVGNRLTLPDMARGTYLRFKPYGTDDNVRTEEVFLWNIDNHDYFIYAQAATDPRENAFPIGANLYGINLATLNPRNIASSRQGKIFESLESSSVDYTTLDGANGEYIKEGFEYTKYNKGLGSKSEKMRYKAESVKNSWSLNVDLSASKHIKGVEVDGGVGVGYKEFDETHKNQKEVYLERSEWKSKYRITCDSSLADLDERFMVSVRNLPLEYDAAAKKEYEKFVNDYGTHFLSEVIYGGFYNSFLAMSENSFNSLQGNGLDVKADLGVSAGGTTETTDINKSPSRNKEIKTSSNNSKGAKLSVSYSKTHEKALEEHFSGMEGGYEYAGGDGSFDSWSLNEDEVVPVIIKPQLISVLISPEVFKDDTDPDQLYTIKGNLEKYLIEYIGKMPKKMPIEAPPVAYTLEIDEVTISKYKDDGDATKKADISIKAYSGALSRLRGNQPTIDYSNGEVEKQLVREANINPGQKLGKPLSPAGIPKIGLVVKPGNPEKRVFKIAGTFKEYDSNFGGTPEEWVASGYINTDLTDAKPSRTGELRLLHSAKRWGSQQQFDVIVKYTLTRDGDIFDIPEGAQVIQSNQTEQISAGELVTDPALDTKKITLRHKGAYVAKYTIEYTAAGTKKTIHTGEVTSGNEDTYSIPADATNVSIKAEGATGLVWEPWVTHFKQNYPRIEARTIESYGTTLNQSYKELNEKGGIISQGNTPPPPADTKRITFKNKGAFVARYSLEYILQGRLVSENTGSITSGREKSYDIPRVATNVKIKGEGATGLAWEPWRKHIEKTYPTAITKTIESKGTTLNQSAREY